MAIQGGDIQDIQYSYPAPIGSGVFFAKADEDVELNFGGFMVNDDDAGITGAGDLILTKTRKRASASFTMVWDQGEEDFQIAQQIQDEGSVGNWTITLNNGKVYLGSGTIVGELTANAKDCTAPVKLAFGGKIETLNA